MLVVITLKELVASLKTPIAIGIRWNQSQVLSWPNFQKWRKVSWELGSDSEEQVLRKSFAFESYLCLTNITTLSFLLCVNGHSNCQSCVRRQPDLPAASHILYNANMNVGAKKDPDSEIMMIPSERAAGMEAREVLGYMRVNPADGLTVTEASGRRNLHGFNEVTVSKPDPLWKKYLDQFNNPFILLLLASAVISVFMRQFDDAGKPVALFFFVFCGIRRTRVRILQRLRLLSCHSFL